MEVNGISFVLLKWASLGEIHLHFRSGNEKNVMSNCYYEWIEVEMTPALIPTESSSESHLPEAEERIT